MEKEKDIILNKVLEELKKFDEPVKATKFETKLIVNITIVEMRNYLNRCLRRC